MVLRKHSDTHVQICEARVLDIILLPVHQPIARFICGDLTVSVLLHMCGF